MADHILSGRPPVALTLRRSARARRISLRVSQLDGRVTLTVPKGVSEAEALEFAGRKGDWIRGHLRDRPGDITVENGVLVPVEGVARRVIPASGRRVVLNEGEIAVPSGATGPRLQSWLRALARDRLAVASDRFAADLGRSYSRLTLRDTRSRWGSCSSRAGLNFSWRLILAPSEVLNYVAAHEVAHLAEMNHSPAFWSTVEHLYGPYETPRLWLRKNGTQLHRYRFTT